MNLLEKEQVLLTRALIPTLAALYATVQNICVEPSQRVKWALALIMINFPRGLSLPTDASPLLGGALLVFL